MLYNIKQREKTRENYGTCTVQKLLNGYNSVETGFLITSAPFFQTADNLSKWVAIYLFSGYNPQLMGLHLQDLSLSTIIVPKLVNTNSDGIYKRNCAVLDAMGARKQPQEFCLLHSRKIERSKVFDKE